MTGTTTVIPQRELVGDDKVGILPKRVNSLALARQLATSLDLQNCDDAFMVADLDHIVDRFNLWKKELPMIEPFYAVKCNTDPVLVRCLAALGTGFDCASREEIDIVMKMGVSADRIIYANPCKTRSFITHAKEKEVRMMTFDNAEELLKISMLHPTAQMILRIAVSDPTATCPLNLKFGCDPELVAPKLLKRAAELGVDVIGVSFHVGSGCNDANAYRLALQHTKNIFEIGEGLGFNMRMVDLGGGFPGAEHHLPFEKIAQVIRNALDEFFEDSSVRIVAEPGRYFAAGTFSLVTNVLHATQVPAFKITKNEKDERVGYMYYLNDGVYGSFNCILFDHVHPSGEPLFSTGGANYITTIWGPTCDSLDMIETKKMMPKMEIGDWIYYSNMGAYTSAAATTFNGFAKPNVVYIMSAEMWTSIRSSPHV
ncbi:unnamed protein product [Caenorhabditis auriculariae]|uniref:ornithine decarboxylase n=1 Tax=Caenorhabditis auriculariae TaxID=2777116 RepID=A0A8S1HWP8_9PELO|nr:unnamed protein product [Caenorhabditis auriculariae]